MQNQPSTINHSETSTTSVSFSKPLQLIGALFLGVVILYGAGFVNTPAVHNAAHDTRHAQGFPCH